MIDLKRTQLNDSTFVPIFNPIACVAFGWWHEDSLSYYIATDVAGTDSSLVPENFPMDVRKRTPKNGVLFYAKALSGTPWIVTVITQ